MLLLLLLWLLLLPLLLLLLLLLQLRVLLQGFGEEELPAVSTLLLLTCCASPLRVALLLSSFASPLRHSHMTRCPVQPLYSPDLHLPLLRWCRSFARRGLLLCRRGRPPLCQRTVRAACPWLVTLRKKRSKPEYHCLCLLCLSLRCACCSSVNVAPN